MGKGLGAMNKGVLGRWVHCLDGFGDGGQCEGMDRGETFWWGYYVEEGKWRWGECGLRWGGREGVAVHGYEFSQERCEG